MRHLVPLCVVLLLLLSTPLTAQQQDQLLPSQQLVAAPAAAATDAAAVTNPFDVMNSQQVVAGYDGALVSPAPSLIPGETGTGDDIQAQGTRSRTCPSGCVVPRNNRRRRSNCQCVTQASRSMKTARCCAMRCSKQKLSLRYTVRGRITQEGRRVMEEGVVQWLVGQGVNPRSININSVLQRSGSRSNSVGNSAPMAANAAIIQLSEWDYVANKTVILKGQQEEVAPTAAELAEGVAALDAETVRGASELVPEPTAVDGVSAQSSRSRWFVRSSRRGPFVVIMYVSFCAPRGTCLNLKNQWNRGGPCSSPFKGMCVDYFCAEGELGCVNKGSVVASGATPPGSCDALMAGRYPDCGGPLPPDPSPSPRPPPTSPSPAPSPQPSPSPFPSPSPSPRPSPSPGVSPSPSPGLSPSPSPSPPLPTCRNSSLPLPPPNAQWPNTCDNGFIGDQCPATCSAGYTGSPFVVCTSNGWSSNITGTCVPQTTVCTNATLPTLPPNAIAWSPACNSVGASATCTAICGANYTGTPTATCGSNGTFLPTVTGNCTLKPPVVCSNSSLPGVPPNATNWSPDCNSLQAGRTCTAVCGANYTGTPTATCGANGTFLPPVTGNCTLKPPVVVCFNSSLPGVPPNATNWSPECNGIQAGKTCTAVCGANYTGSPTATCGVNGTFLPTVTGNCTLKPPVVDCKNITLQLGNPANASTWASNCTGAPAGSTCAAVCNTNFTGNPTAACDANGNWTNTGQPCTPVVPLQTCGNITSQLGTPANISSWPSSCTGLVQGSNCTGTCNPGFSGPPVATCSASGNWTLVTPCVLTSPVTQCPALPLPLPPNINTTASGCTGVPQAPGVNDTCSLVCLPGYNGSITIQCGAGFVWGNYIGSCTPITCGPAPALPNNTLNGSSWNCSLSPGDQFQSVCSAVCAPGFIGTPNATCTANGTWTQSGACMPDVCNPNTRPSTSGSIMDISWTNATCIGSPVPGQLCSTQCPSNYSGTVNATCLSGGAWTVIDNCVLKQECPHMMPPTPPGVADTTTGTCTTYNVSGVCTIPCLPGYTGGVNISCNATSSGPQWGPYFGSCDPISCGTAPALPNNTVNGSSWNCSLSPANQSVCSAVCAPGFIGTPTATCTANGNWTTSDVCTPVVCNSARLQVNSNATAWSCVGNVGNVTYQTVCTASCKTNFTGSLNATCGADGNWEGPFDQCEPLCFIEDLPPFDKINLGTRRLLSVPNITWPINCQQPNTVAPPGFTCNTDCPNPQEGTGVNATCVDGNWQTVKNCTGGNSTASP